MKDRGKILSALPIKQSTKAPLHHQFQAGCGFDDTKVNSELAGQVGEVGFGLTWAQCGQILGG